MQFLTCGEVLALQRRLLAETEVGHQRDREIDCGHSGGFHGQEALVVHSDPEILGGTPVFVGTRVPLRNLIDYLERGHSLDEFLNAFPSVTREQAVAGARDGS